MRFFVFRQTKPKNDEKRKRSTRRGFVAVACTLIVAVGLFLWLSPRFKPMSDVPSVPLIYAENYWGMLYSLDFQKGSRTPLPREQQFPDRSQSEKSITLWACSDGHCRGKVLVIATEKQVYGSYEDSHGGGTVIGPVVYGSVEGDFLDWSPDGQWITFHGYMESNDPETLYPSKRELWMINIQTEELVRLTNNDIPDFDPWFSPDGSQVTYVSGSQGHETISILDISTKTSYVVAHVPYASRTIWSPDGEWIAFETPPPGRENTPYWEHRVSIVRLDSTHLQSLTTGPSRLVGWDSTPDLYRKDQ